MIVKPPKKSKYILTLESLLRRLPDNHPKRHDLENLLARLLAGYQGEKAMEYYFKFLPQKDYYIFHHLRLPFLDVYFQIDYLIYSRKFILVSEIKSLSGIVHLDKNFKQLIQRKDDELNSYSDPIIQVTHQCNQLKQLLQKNKMATNHTYPIPIEKLVVFTNPHTVLEATPGYTEAYKYVIRKENFLNHIKKLDQQYKNEIFDQREMRKLSRKLLKLHTEERVNVFERFQINKEDIQKGVRCTNKQCEKFHMIWRRGTWACPYCCHTDKLAHKEALEDYERLISPTITNKQCRDFLMIDCIHTTKRVLHTLNFNKIGERKSRKYILQFSEGTK